MAKSARPNRLERLPKVWYNLGIALCLGIIAACVIGCGLGTAPGIPPLVKLLLEKEGSEDQRLRILDQKRRILLGEIHSCEKRLSHLDYLRYNIRKNQDKKQTV